MGSRQIISRSRPSFARSTAQKRPSDAHPSTPSRIPNCYSSFQGNSPIFDGIHSSAGGNLFSFKGRPLREGLGGAFAGRGHVAGGERSLRYLVTGAKGQIGSEFVPYLRERVGAGSVLASDVNFCPSLGGEESDCFVKCDVTSYREIEHITREHHIDYIIHFASLLSAAGEKDPERALKTNVMGIQNVLEVARKHKLSVFAPSSIAVFGPTTPKLMTPDITVTEPTTIYGITKMHLELLGRYYKRVHGVDFCSLRYPGIISAKTKPGGGTTDYAVEIFHGALRDGSYSCFLEPHQELPMMYMRDCLKATFAIIRAPPEQLTQTVYNVAAMSFNPTDLARAIQKRIPYFQMRYKPDFRQGIAQTWPRSIDDTCARKDWGWHPDYDIQDTVDDMLAELDPLYKFEAACSSSSSEVAVATSFSC